MAYLLPKWIRHLLLSHIAVKPCARSNLLTEVVHLFLTDRYVITWIKLI